MLLTSNQTTTFQDLFKNSFLNLFPEQMAPMTLVLTLAIAFAVGMGIYVIYRKCFIGVVYDHSFCLSLVIMTVLVSVIIVTISTNVTLSLGMVGALLYVYLLKPPGSDVPVLGHYFGNRRGRASSTTSR